MGAFRQVDDNETGMNTVLKGVVIGAGMLSLHAIRVAKKLGIHTVALDGDPLAEGLNLADESYIVDVSNEEETVRALKEIQPHINIPVPVGRILTTAGRINDAFHLKGVSYQSALLCTDKLKFHDTLSQFGARSIKCCLIHKEKSLTTFTPSEYPLIAKPRYGSGSKGVLWLNDKESAHESLNELDISNTPYIVEQAVSGTEYGVDATVLEGQLHIVLIRKKLLTPPPARQSVGYIAEADRNSWVYKQTQTTLSRAVTALGFQNCTLHADIIAEKNQNFIVEISARPAGHYLYDVFTPFASGIDVVREYLNFATGCGHCFEPKIIKRCGIGYFDFSNVTVHRVPTQFEIFNNPHCRVIEYVTNIGEGDWLPPVVEGPTLMARGYFIVEGDSEASIVKQLVIVKDMFHTTQEGRDD